MAKKKAPGRYDFETMLRESIESRGMTCYQIGQESGVHPTVISRFLKGPTGITSSSMSKIVNALNIRYVEVGTVKAKGKRT
jgi:ribosome-binding protein aMBF1 (putative translation factor)